MKKIKIIPAITFLLIFAAYFGIYSQYAVSSTFEDLSTKDKIIYLSLDENEKIKIINLPQDSVSVKSDFSDSSKIILRNIPSETYNSYQNMSEQITTVSEYIFYAKRFILLVFILIMAYITYSKKHKFNITFQKILFGDAIETLKYGLIYSILIAVFIYFEPRNIHWYQKRLERKKKNEEKKD
jgi:hypothetical protein